MSGVRERAVFRGRVQGVGFRMTCRGMAQSLGLVGWVRNEANGTVLVEIEGPESVVETFFMRVPGAIWGRVDGVERSRIAVRSSETDFEVSP